VSEANVAQKETRQRQIRSTAQASCATVNRNGQCGLCPHTNSKSSIQSLESLDSCEGAPVCGGSPSNFNFRSAYHWRRRARPASLRSLHQAVAFRAAAGLCTFVADRRRGHCEWPPQERPAWRATRRAFHSSRRTRSARRPFARRMVFHARPRRVLGTPAPASDPPGSFASLLRSS